MKLLIRKRGRRDSKGRFRRIRKPWSLDNFEDGYIDATGRMRVYYPGHLRASNMGYVMRSIVAYETYHDIEVTEDFTVHHKDSNRLNDRRYNLELMEFGEHSKMHWKDKRIGCICGFCKEEFFLPKYRIDDGRGKFCSQECYQYWRSI